MGARKPWLRRRTFETQVNRALAAPADNLRRALLLVLTVIVTATFAYRLAGWSLGDALYMVTLTIFSVGYGEVHPIDTSYLRIVTNLTIAVGCTAMILLTGALVQLLTHHQLLSLLGINKMQNDIDRLRNHVIVCGFGRIGIQLAQQLHEAGTPFVILDKDPAKVAEIRAQGMLCLTGEATDEAALKAAGIDRARVLATVLPNDAANVFITLSARSLNQEIEIIARGEATSTENKLLHAGASRVVLPTHIGAERIASMILYPATDLLATAAPELQAMMRNLREFGLELEMVEVNATSAMVGKTVGMAESEGNGAYFIVQIDRSSGQSVRQPEEDVEIEAGDRIALVVRNNRLSAGALFMKPRRGGRRSG